MEHIEAMTPEQLEVARQIAERNRIRKLQNRGIVSPGLLLTRRAFIGTGLLLIAGSYCLERGQNSSSNDLGSGVVVSADPASPATDLVELDNDLVQKVYYFVPKGTANHLVNAIAVNARANMAVDSERRHQLGEVFYRIKADATDLGMTNDDAMLAFALNDVKLTDPALKMADEYGRAHNYSQDKLNDPMFLKVIYQKWIMENYPNQTGILYLFYLYGPGNGVKMLKEFEAKNPNTVPTLGSLLEDPVVIGSVFENPIAKAQEIKDEYARRAGLAIVAATVS